MSSADYVKVETTYFTTQPDDIRMNEVVYSRRRYTSSSFRSTSRNAPSKSQRMENNLASLERYSLMLTTKSSTTTRHWSLLRILVQHQFHQRPAPRAHHQDHNRINLRNTRIVYSNTNTIYANTIRRKRSTRNIKQDLQSYVTWLQATPGNPLYWNTTTGSLGFVLWILSYLWTTSGPTMELSPPKNYKRMRLH